MEARKINEKQENTHARVYREYSLPPKAMPYQRMEAVGMETHETNEKQENPHARAHWKYGLLLKAIIIVVIIGALVIGGGAVVGFVRRTSSRAVQVGLRNIGELATQEACVTSVQTIEKAREMFSITVPGTTTKRIFSYDCRIKAGLDFGQIALAVDVVNKVVTVTLPKIAVLSTEIDTDSMRIYDERKNMFAQLTVDDVNAALVNMKEEVERSAIENGLLKNAQSNAETLIRGFLASVYNPEEWSIEFVSAEE